jgi:hypothetical protein
MEAKNENPEVRRYKKVWNKKLEIVGAGFKPAQSQEIPGVFF